VKSCGTSGESTESLSKEKMERWSIGKSKVSQKQMFVNTTDEIFVSRLKSKSFSTSRVR